MSVKHFEFIGNDPLTVQLTNGETKTVKKGDVVSNDADWGPSFFNGRDDFKPKTAAKKAAAKTKETSK